MSTLKEKTAQGLLWGGLNSGIQQLVGLAFGIVLGRLLAPSDYGMMAMISIFSLVATALQDSGFRTALTNIEHPKHEDYNSVFWFNIIMASSLYVILFLAAPRIGEYYHTPRVVPLCRYAFLSIVIASLGTAQSAYLFKHLRAKQQAEAGALAVIVSSLTGVGMAFAGMAYWSLATQGLVYVGINTLLQWHFSPWRPSIHGITFAPVRRMFRFSCKILATTIMTHVNNNVLNILLGHYFTPRDTGNYNQAYQWNTKCYSLVQSMVAQVAQPVLVSLNGEEGRQKDVPQDDALHGVHNVPPAVRFRTRGKGVYRHSHWREVACFSTTDTDTVPLGRHYAALHALLQHDYIEGTVGHFLLVYVHLRTRPDSHNDNDLAHGHTHNGHSLYIIKYVVAAGVAVLRAPADRLRLLDVLLRCHAVRTCSRRSDGRGLCSHNAAEQLDSASRHKIHYCRSALLCRDEGGTRENTRRM